VYVDKGLPALKEWLTRAAQPGDLDERLIPDEQAGISAALIELVDVLRAGADHRHWPEGCDVTPKPRCTHKEMPGFGEQMRRSV
jgi:molybdopterin adenylyltransferase